MQRVLVIGHVWPEPCATAAGSYIVQILQALREHGADVTFACAAQRSDQAAALTDLGVQEQAITLNCSSFDTWIATLQPDTVLFDRFMVEEQFGWRVEQECPDAVRVLVTQDLHALRDARHQRIKAALHNQPLLDALPPLSTDSMASALLDSELAVREISAIYRSDLSLLVSPAERDFLTHHVSVPDYLLHVCPLFYDIAALAQRTASHGKPFAERHGFASIGNFLHAPNHDAVGWLRDVIWPRIRAQLPQAELHIYGAYTPAAVQHWHKPAHGFLVHGQADDALDVLGNARVLLAPLRFGAGIKGKLAEAMLCDTPSVTTSIGAEGMHAPDTAWCGAIADDVGAMVAAAVGLYTSAAAWEQAVMQGRALRQRFDRRTVGPALVAALADAQTRRDVRRQANFTGRMLRHHLHRSSHYMARWIEAKNALLRERSGQP